MGKDLQRNFYPRPPGGGRQDDYNNIIILYKISIHALRVEGDSILRTASQRNRDFYPRPPGGGRRIFSSSSSILLRFLSTPSGWRATLHVLIRQVIKRRYFYPRPPGGGRPLYIEFAETIDKFLSTPSGWRATTSHLSIRRRDAISIHALRVEGDLLRHARRFKMAYFYPRPPGGGRLRHETNRPVVFKISIHALRVEGDVSYAISRV